MPSPRAEASIMKSMRSRSANGCCTSMPKRAPNNSISSKNWVVGGSSARSCAFSQPLLGLCQRTSSASRVAVSPRKYGRNAAREVRRYRASSQPARRPTAARGPSASLGGRSARRTRVPRELADPAAHRAACSPTMRTCCRACRRRRGRRVRHRIQLLQAPERPGPYIPVGTPNGGAPNVRMSSAGFQASGSISTVVSGMPISVATACA